VESAWHHLATATIPVSRPQDAAEREADRVADAVMAGEAPARRERNSAGVQRGCAACGEDRQERGGPLQPKAAAGPPRQEQTGAQAAAGLRASSGWPLSEQQRAFFEPRFGRSFADVRLHTDAAANAAARSLDACARDAAATWWAPTR
jgi:hypothetical protein